MSEIEPKKMIRRGVAVALGIICIILVACLGGLMAYYTFAISDRDNTISSKNNQIDSLNTQISRKNSQISQLNSNLTNLQNQVNNLTDVLNLNRSTVWVSGKEVNLWSRDPVYEGNVTYAGYIVVHVSTGWPNNTLVMNYTFQDLNYENKTFFSGDVTATFPVLPSSNIKVFAFTEAWILTGPADAYVTIIYYY